MKITFKNVGQGDSIILEWQHEGNSKIGIIDCRKVGKDNPVIEHLKTFDWGSDRMIDFIILSHPHYDHFSGMSDLLDYCDSNNITVKIFAHSFSIQKQRIKYLNWANFNDERTKQLDKLLHKLRTLNHGTIRKLITISEYSTIPLSSDEYSLKCVRPSHNEDERYCAMVDKYRDSQKAESSAANLFSTVLMLQSEKCYTLFTSDATKETFDDILLKDMEERFVDKSLALAQIPHHGARRNHQFVFWEHIQRERPPVAVISAGEHKKYNHPNIQVVEDFEGNNYSVYATNDVNGMADFLNEIAQIKSDKANMYNKSIEERYDKSRDLSFELKYGAALYAS